MSIKSVFDAIIRRCNFVRKCDKLVTECIKFCNTMADTEPTPESDKKFDDLWERLFRLRKSLQEFRSMTAAHKRLYGRNIDMALMGIDAVRYGDYDLYDLH